MIVTLRTERIRTLEQVRAFLDGSGPADFDLDDRDSAYLFVRRLLERLRHHGLGKPDRGLVKAYLALRTTLRTRHQGGVSLPVRGSRRRAL